MCILFIYRNPDAPPESHRLIIAANRDEDIKRPALPAHYWRNHPGCIGGVDMEPGKEGGTWLAVSLKGKAGIILNLTNEEGTVDSPKQGRGSLIADYVATDVSTEVYLDRLHKENQKGQPYNPFCLILVDLFTGDASYLDSCRRSKGVANCEGSILGFGNSGMKVPYKKVEAGKEKFERIVQSSSTSNQDVLIDELLKFLKSKERHLPDPELKKRSPAHYVELSSIYVSLPEYGTRTHSILLVDGSNKLTFVEETLLASGKWHRQVFKASLKQQN